MIGADALLKSLENQNVKQIFAYPGGAVLPIYDRMQEYDIRRVLVRHEQGAAFAAAGLSRASQEIGVCLATSGPGATNLITGIADAKLDSIPMVILTGNVVKHLIGSDAFQEIDIVGVCEPIVKHSYFVEYAEDLPRIIEEAFYLAKSGRPGPVLIDIPKSVQAEEISDKLWQKIVKKEKIKMSLPGYYYEFNDKFFNDQEIEKATQILSKAKKPIVIFGHGVVLSNAESELKKFLDKTKIPAVWTLHGIGAMDTKSKNCFGMIGMHGTAAANFAAHDADVIIGIGIRFDDRITGTLDAFQRNKKIIHFDIDPSEFDKNVYADVKICGEIKNLLPLLTQKINDLGDQIKTWTNTLEKKHKLWPISSTNGKKLTEITVIEEIFKNTDDDSIVIPDVGQNQMWTAQRFVGKKSRKFLSSGGLGTMGFSLPTAVGACFSGFETWSISGDGGFQMNLQELGTIAQENLPIKICILNNGFLGMVRQWQELFYDKNYEGTPLWNPNFKAIGEAYSIPSYYVDNLDDAKKMIKKMKNHKGPILCEFFVKREENVFPMVPAGKDLGQTLLNKIQTI